MPTRAEPLIAESGRSDLAKPIGGDAPALERLHQGQCGFGLAALV